jgi:phosphatidylserine decarboxylase
LNERSSIVVTSESGTEILVRQVAGAVARRIVTYSRKGEKYTREMNWDLSSSDHALTYSSRLILKLMFRCSSR